MESESISNIISFKANIYEIFTKKLLGQIIYSKGQIIINVKNEVVKNNLKKFFSSKQEFLIPGEKVTETKIVEAFPIKSGDLLLLSLSNLWKINLYSKIIEVNGKALNR